MHSYNLEQGKDMLLSILQFSACSADFQLARKRYKWHAVWKIRNKIFFFSGYLNRYIENPKKSIKSIKEYT